MFRQGIKFGYSEKSTPPPQQPSDEEIYKYLSKFWDFMEDAQIDDTQGRWSVKDFFQAYMKKHPLRN